MRSICLMVWVVVSAGIYVETKGIAQTNPAAQTTVHLTESERAWIRAHPEVRWGVDPDWPPFSYSDVQRQLVGIDAEITRKVAERVGIKLKHVTGRNWADVLKRAEEGEIDFLSGTALTSERAQKFNFTDDYGTFPVVIITREDEPFYTLPSQLISKKISVPRDTVITWQLQRDYPTGLFVYTDTTEEALDLVARKKVDATVCNLAVATRIIRLGGLTNLKISGVTRYEFPLHFAVRKDAPELVSILNKGLATVSELEQEKMYAAHLMPDIAKARDWGAWRRRALYSILIGSALVGIVSVWNLFLSREIRQRKGAELALRDARDRLERRTRQLDMRVGEVELLNEELQAANQDLESFTGSVSHDLRSPLRRICAFAEMIHDKVDGGSKDEDTERMTSAILKESTQMDRLIRDLLEFARIGRAELRTQRIDLEKLVNGVINDFRPDLDSRKVVWKVGRLGEVMADPSLLRSAITNLIDNALKYSRRNAETKIRIDILSEHAEDSETVFYVEDNGTGFEMSEAEHLFAPFQRLHSSADFEGTGIGLANVHRIIQRHGGRIWFKSETGQGATFFFTLPGTTPEMRLTESVRQEVVGRAHLRPAW